MSTLSNSIISQSLRQPLQKDGKIYVNKHLTPRRTGGTDKGRKREKKTRRTHEKKQDLKHIIHTASLERSEITEQYMFDFLPLFLSAGSSLINLLLSAHKCSLFFGEDQESE